MKVIIISRGIPSDTYPLYGIFELDQAKALAKSGIEVALLAIDFRSFAFKRKHGFFCHETDGVKTYELSLPIGAYRKALPLLSRLTLSAYDKAVKDFGQPDIIHAHFYFMAAIASFIKSKRHVPLVVTEHSSKLNKNKDEISKIDIRLAEKAYANSDRIIAVSSAFANQLHSNFGIRCDVVNNIVSTKSFHCTEKHTENEPFAFVSVGQLLENKGHDIVIEAFSKLPENKKMRLFIIGDGPERCKLEQQIQDSKLNENVILKGQLKREEIQEVFAHSDAFVLASHSETFGLSYIEAMLSGLPVIATDCGGPSDFVNKENGIIIACNNANALAEAMGKMISDIHLYDGKSISLKCEERFSPKTIASKILEIYRQIVK